MKQRGKVPVKCSKCDWEFYIKATERMERIDAYTRAIEDYKEWLKKHPPTTNLPPKPRPTSGKREESKGGIYREWNPPAPTTIYCKIYDIPYRQYKHGVSMAGKVPPAIDTIAERLDSHIYCCGMCAYFCEPRCTLKKWHSVKNAICKSFDVKKS
jgi:transcription elongation factor Elf1